MKNPKGGVGGENNTMRVTTLNH